MTDRRLWSPVTRTIWTDQGFRSLTPAPPSAQTLWLYLLTGPDQGPIPGLFVSGAGSLTDRLQSIHSDWTYELVREYLLELRAAGMLCISASPPLFWMPKVTGHRAPPNANQVVGWRRHFVELPECTLRTEAMLALRAWLPDKTRPAFDQTFPELGYAKPLGEPLNGSPSRERERDREVAPKDETPERLARTLLEGIRLHLPEYADSRVKPRHVATWAKDIGRIIRLDGYPAATVERVIRLVHHQGDPSVVFWRPNILSGAKLREKFPQVLGQARGKGAIASNGAAGKPWHIQNAKALRRLRDSFAQQGRPLTAEAIAQSAPAARAPTAEQASAGLLWLEKR